MCVFLLQEPTQDTMLHWAVCSSLIQSIWANLVGLSPAVLSTCCVPYPGEATSNGQRWIRPWVAHIQVAHVPPRYVHNDRHLWRTVEDRSSFLHLGPHWGHIFRSPGKSQVIHSGLQREVRKGDTEFHLLDFDREGEILLGWAGHGCLEFGNVLVSKKAERSIWHWENWVCVCLGIENFLAGPH